MEESHQKGALVVERKEGGTVIVSLPPAKV
jgi:hypothetical protein